ncbi:hypothetical protein BV133_384 [Blastochloris viridis]|uniref:Uncharacterized protein n=1 Tax=Blastochloris viridis TaxID=1079 RepID=A0A182CYW0_BLAVI|nr:hypothetical protein BV133_384 [Blastochloris viridis]
MSLDVPPPGSTGGGTRCLRRGVAARRAAACRGRFASLLRGYRHVGGAAFVLL